MQWWCNEIKFNWSNQMIRSSDLLIFFEKTNLSDRSRFAISSTHLIISSYHSTASSIFQQLLEIDDTLSRVRRNSLWSWKKFLETNNSNRYKDDDTRDDNMQADEKSKRFEHSTTIKKEEIQQLFSSHFSTTRTTILRLRYYSTNISHLLIRRLINFYTTRVCRERT
jgi:hypothetical protein